MAPAACLQRKHEVVVELLGASTDLHTDCQDANENERQTKTMKQMKIGKRQGKVAAQSLCKSFVKHGESRIAELSEFTPRRS